MTNFLFMFGFSVIKLNVVTILLMLMLMSVQSYMYIVHPLAYLHINMSGNFRLSNITNHTYHSFFLNLSFTWFISSLRSSISLLVSKVLRDWWLTLQQTCRKLKSFRGQIFRSNFPQRGKSNALTRIDEFPPIFLNLPLALLGC